MINRNKIDGRNFIVSCAAGSQPITTGVVYLVLTNRGVLNNLCVGSFVDR